MTICGGQRDGPRDTIPRTNFARAAGPSTALAGYPRPSANCRVCDVETGDAPASLKSTETWTVFVAAFFTIARTSYCIEPPAIDTEPCRPSAQTTSCGSPTKTHLPSRNKLRRVLT